MVDTQIQGCFAHAVSELTRIIEAARINVQDEDTDAEVRRWIDGTQQPLNWAGPGITPDEWFFMTTLYGTMNPDGQRTHIRTFFPMFVQHFERDTSEISLMNRFWIGGCVTIG